MEALARDLARNGGADKNEDEGTEDDNPTHEQTPWNLGGMLDATLLDAICLPPETV